MMAVVPDAPPELKARMEVLRNSPPSHPFVESDIHFQSCGLKVVATLTRPDAPGVFPPVIMLPGSRSPRHELIIRGLEEGMFDRAARKLARHGIASLRLDYRGSGQSEGSWEDTTFSSQIADALAALDTAGSAEGVDPARIGLLGMSQGGLVASATAGRDGRVKSAVLWSPLSAPLASFIARFGLDGVKHGLVTGETPLMYTTPWGDTYGLKAGFFEDLFRVDPTAEISRFKGALAVIVGLRDESIAPQPQMGQMLLRYHPGTEKALVVLDGDHTFNVLADGPALLDEVIAYTLAWFERTL